MNDGPGAAARSALFRRAQDAVSTELPKPCPAPYLPGTDDPGKAHALASANALLDAIEVCSWTALLTEDERFGARCREGIEVAIKAMRSHGGMSLLPSGRMDAISHCAILLADDAPTRLGHCFNRAFQYLKADEELAVSLVEAMLAYVPVCVHACDHIFGHLDAGGRLPPNSITGPAALLYLGAYLDGHPNCEEWRALALRAVAAHFAPQNLLPDGGFRSGGARAVFEAGRLLVPALEARQALAGFPPEEFEPAPGCRFCDIADWLLRLASPDGGIPSAGLGPRDGGADARRRLWLLKVAAWRGHAAAFQTFLPCGRECPPAVFTLPPAEDRAEPSCRTVIMPSTGYCVMRSGCAGGDIAAFFDFSPQSVALGLTKGFDLRIFSNGRWWLAGYAHTGCPDVSGASLAAWNNITVDGVEPAAAGEPRLVAVEHNRGATCVTAQRYLRDAMRHRRTLIHPEGESALIVMDWLTVYGAGRSRNYSCLFHVDASPVLRERGRIVFTSGAASMTALSPQLAEEQDTTGIGAETKAGCEQRRFFPMRMDVSADARDIRFLTVFLFNESADSQPRIQAATDGQSGSLRISRNGKPPLVIFPPGAAVGT